MAVTDTARPVDQITGVIREVDLVGRRLKVLVGGVDQVFDLGPECAIYLHDEPVRLRLLQPMDRAQIGYVQDGEELVARVIRVSWWGTGRR